MKDIYKHSPEKLKPVLEKIYSKAPFPLAYGPEFLREYKRFMKTQWLSKCELEKMQNEQLKSIINHAYDNVPYYTNVFDSLEIWNKMCMFYNILHNLQFVNILNKIFFMTPGISRR